jgi:formylglycine-generating enzyme required for sulfatase activity
VFRVRLLRWMALVILIASCSPAPPTIPATLTAPAPTPTSESINLAPPQEIGSAFVYADGTVLMAVPHGEFLMGHGMADNPEHTVILSDFWIYSTEVTNYQYSLCIDQGRCAPPDQSDNPEYQSFDGLNKPVVGVAYEQARAYCSFMNAELPTEAQWEKAARGAEGRPFPWGDEDPSCDLLNFNNCLKHTTDVTANPDGAGFYGALNMAGNVYEWVADWYDPVYYESSESSVRPASEAVRTNRSCMPAPLARRWTTVPIWASAARSPIHPSLHLRANLHPESMRINQAEWLSTVRRSQLRCRSRPADMGVELS